MKLKTFALQGLLTLSLAFSATSAIATSLTLNDLAWLSGCWKAKPDQSRVNNMEQWSKPFGNVMMGVGAELTNGQLSSWEHMKIESGKDGKIVLQLRPHNQKEVAFTLTGDKAETLTFENPKNEFPQKVIYRREKDGSMEIRIDGKVKDVQRAALFPMVRMPCE
jgi:hypothetical protein